MVNIADAGGLGTMELAVPEGSQSVTPASYVCLAAIGAHRERLHGIGIDWGSGSGCLAIAAARIPEVRRVVGIDLSPGAVLLANENAESNGVAHKVVVVHGDDFEPMSAADRLLIEELEGGCGFLVANPPASEGDDGLGWRRRVLEGARRFLAPGALVFLQVSYQYGERIRRLADDVPGYVYHEVLSTTDWVVFDQSRSDLALGLRQYAEEERRGGPRYVFRDPAGAEGADLTATEALAGVRAGKPGPLSKWQMHLYRWQGDPGREASGAT